MTQELSVGTHKPTQHQTTLHTALRQRRVHHLRPTVKMTRPDKPTLYTNTDERDMARGDKITEEIIRDIMAEGEVYEYEIDEQVRIHGLTGVYTQILNGKLGRIVPQRTEGRVSLYLNEDVPSYPRTINVKPMNLEPIDDTPDACNTDTTPLTQETASTQEAAQEPEQNAKGPRLSKAEHRRRMQAVWAWREFRAARYGGRREAGRKGLAKCKELREIMMRTDLSNRERQEGVRSLCETKLAEATRLAERIDYVGEDDLAQGIRKLEGRSRAGMNWEIYDIIRRMTKRITASGDKISEILDTNGIAHSTPERALEAAREQGQYIHKEGIAYVDEVEKMIDWLELDIADPGTGKGLERAMTWSNFQQALNMCTHKKGVGVDGYNPYLLRRASEATQRMYWLALTDMVTNLEFPLEYKEWVALLLSKGASEDQRDITRRRDIWLSPGGQKILMKMLNIEYTRAADIVVPECQAAYSIERSTSEQLLCLRLVQQQAAAKRSVLCVGMQDYSQFFMMCVKSICSMVERKLKVDPAVIKVIEELHSHVTGKYDTYWGLSKPFDIRRGVGQGCVNGAIRAKILQAVTQRVIRKVVRGYDMTQGPSCPQLHFADDSCYLTNSVADLQLAYDTAWVMAKLCGLKLKVKTEKTGTAFMATHWVGNTQHDILGCNIQLPDGRDVPQICMGGIKDRPAHASFNPRSVRRKKGTNQQAATAKEETRTYKYLGQLISPSATRGLEPARQALRKKTISILKFTSRLTRLTHEQMREIMDVEIAGNVGYHARSLPLRFEDCRAIESARVQALKTAGYTPAIPALQVYETEENMGMGHTHAYAIATASLIDQIDKGLAGPNGAPVKIALESSIAETCYRLGCRDQHPLEWHPTHLTHTLDQDDVIQAWLFSKIIANKQGVKTAHEFKNYNAVLGQSMAARVCMEDAALESSASQSQLFSQLKDYIGEEDASWLGNSGPMMTTMALFMWLLTVS